MKEAVDYLIDSRKQIILKAVVTDYVRTAEPVGSAMLVERYHFGVKSATIRSELAELAEMGYLRQPHTSAGRMPSDRGYRFFVDWLMGSASLDNRQADTALGKLNPHRSEVDIIIEHTCRILADLAQYTSMATSPAIKDATISHISIANVRGDRLLAVVVLSNGRVLHELLELDPKSRRTDPVRATNFLTGRLVGRELTAACAEPMESVPEDAADMAELLDRVVRFLRREAESDGENRRSPRRRRLHDAPAGVQGCGKARDRALASGPQAYALSALLFGLPGAGCDRDHRVRKPARRNA